MILEDKSIGEIKKRENTYIYNIDACYIYKSMIEDITDNEGNIISEKGNYSTKKMSYDKLFTATIPYSLEMIRLDNLYPKEVYKTNKKQYTKSMINITFNKNYVCWRDRKDKDSGEVLLDKDGKIIREKYLTVNKKKMRKYIYVNGFKLDGEEYVFYKRGASKARTGSCLFVKKGMYETLMNRSRLIHKKDKEDKKGLYFEYGEICDITSLNAYQSLILSGLEDIIEIPKKSILIIDDIYSKSFKTISSVTTEENGELKTETKEVTRENNMTDGQGLLDESIFEQADRSKKGMMLLRSDLFKCCAFNTKIQKFFDKMAREGKIKDGKIKDKYRGWVEYKNIKLITTPSSIKYLKFKNKFDDEKECYMSWFDNIDDTFGIVKSDKPGNYGTWNRTTYQIINSMPFTKDQIKELMKDELEYVRLLRTDLAYFKNHIAIKEDITKELESDIEKLDIDSEEDFVSQGDSYSSSEMMNNILSINSDFQHTNLFKQWRRDQIKAYINELRKGKIRLENSIYCTIVANPYEMLLSSVGLYDGNCLANGYEIYCKSYKDGQELATFRNPHINSGNVMVATNKWHNEYIWFNLSKNITIVNVSDNDFPDRGQGFDYDSDTLLHIPNEIFVDVAKQCQIYKTPLNMVKGDSKKRHNNLNDLAELDDTLSNNFIGKIINKSQIINSYMWNCKHKKLDESLINKLYDTSSMLSSLSQIELDKAKKSFDNISMAKELKRINDMKHEDEYVIEFDIEYLFEEFIDQSTGEVTETPILDKKGNQKVNKKMVVPKFFNFVAQDNTYRNLIYFETPMDYLEEIIDGNRVRNTRGSKSIGELIYKPNKLSGDRSRIEHIDKVYDICNEYNKKTISLRLPSCTLSEKGKSIIYKKAKEDSINSISNINMSAKSIYAILQKCFGENKSEGKWIKIGVNLLMLIYNSKHKIKLLALFKNENNKNEKILIKNKLGEVKIFGESYTLDKRLNQINC